jgi:hypothetical protein
MAKTITLLKIQLFYNITQEEQKKLETNQIDFWLVFLAILITQKTFSPKNNSTKIAIRRWLLTCSLSWTPRLYLCS